MLARTFAAVLFSTASFATAAEDLGAGKYSGSYEITPSGHRAISVGVTLDVQSVTDGILTGTVRVAPNVRTPRGCSGDYPVEGRFTDGRLDIRSTEKGGRGADCTVRIRGTATGDKIVGKFNGRDIELRK